MGLLVIVCDNMKMSRVWMVEGVFEEFVKSASVNQEKLTLSSSSNRTLLSEKTLPTFNV